MEQELNSQQIQNQLWKDTFRISKEINNHRIEMLRIRSMEPMFVLDEMAQLTIVVGQKVHTLAEIETKLLELNPNFQYN